MWRNDHMMAKTWKSGPTCPTLPYTLHYNLELWTPIGIMEMSEKSSLQSLICNHTVNQPHKNTPLQCVFIKLCFWKLEWTPNWHTLQRRPEDSSTQHAHHMNKQQTEEWGWYATSPSSTEETCYRRTEASSHLSIHKRGGLPSEPFEGMKTS